MDILELIKNQIDEALKVDNTLIGLNSVLTHIERAEFLLKRAIETEDEHLFTDVIYRTNHSYEGILKEAFEILTTSKAGNKTPYDIESYFLTHSLLNERVIELLKNYRQEWRNPSTHDYNLFFTYNEAFLAIMSISSFLHVFMNQIVEKLYYEKEKEAIKSELTKIKKGIENDYNKLDFIDKVKSIFIAFAKRNLNKSIEELRVSRFETEILGSLTGYIETLDRKIKIEAEPIIKTDNRRLHPDLILEQSKEKLLVELKISRRDRPFLMNRQIFEDQLLSYLIHTQINQGILFILPNEMTEQDEYEVETKELNIGKDKIKIMTIYLKRGGIE
jgi:hypothetical protein